jgi:hypothetical protein
MLARACIGAARGTTRGPIETLAVAQERHAVGQG